MNAALFAYSRRGCATARRVMAVLADWDIQPYTMERFAEDGFAPLGRPAREFYGPIFGDVQAMIFVSSVGLAVREVAPHLKSKATDPAVLVLDELGQYVIPVLSGHIGGANELAKALAASLGAQAVITTATDINGRFSVDAWAVQNGCAIASLPLAKAVSAAVLEGDVPFLSDFPVVTDLPRGLAPGDAGALGVYIGVYEKTPFAKTLRLIPRVVRLGIGCRKGTDEETIRAAVNEALAAHGIDRRAVKCAASIDLKAEEAGLLAYCRSEGLSAEFYTADELRAVRGEFTPSEFVKSITGVDNVCERAALRNAETLLVKKTARSGVTVAAAAEHWEVRFA